MMKQKKPIQSETAPRKRQRESVVDAAKHETETEPSSAAPSPTTKTPVWESDPDGTLAVARGGAAGSSGLNVTGSSIQEVQEKLLEPLTDEQKTLARYHFDGAQGDFTRERRQQLALDDLNPNNSKLTPNQQRHLQQRHGKKTRAVLERLETKRWNAAVQAVQAVAVLQDTKVGLLETENDMERTTAVTQRQLKRQYLTNNTNDTAARNIFDLQLPQTAPYLLKYDRSGRYAILAGQRSGHVAILDNAQQSLLTEFHLAKERIRDVAFLHTFSLAAVAQTNHVYIYDHTGAEIHCLDQHTDPFKLAFLPYHWLLASVGRAGYLKYQDVSTGQLVSTHRTQLGPSTALVSNPANAILHAGHNNGTVTLWSPAQPTYLAKLLCHKGAAITDLTIDLEGRTMVTAGQDKQIRVWDLRMYQQRHAYFCAGNHMPTSLDLSQRGMLAVGHGSHVTVWSADALQRKCSAPYMHNLLGPGGDNHARGPVVTVRFRPFEDVCGVGHAAGVSSLVIPGAGEPALDTSEYHTNPSADAKQRREAEVRALLDKLSPEMITLDSNVVGGIEESDPVTRLERLQDVQEAANELRKGKASKKTGKKRGQSKIQTKLRRRHKNIIDQSVLRIQESEEKKAIIQEIQGGPAGSEAVTSKHGLANSSTVTRDTAPTALKRFF